MAFGYLLKPVDTDELKATVRNLVAHHAHVNNSISDSDAKEKLITLLRNISLIKNTQKVAIPYSKGYKVIDTNDIILPGRK